MSPFRSMLGGCASDEVSSPRVRCRAAQASALLLVALLAGGCNGRPAEDAPDGGGQDGRTALVSQTTEPPGPNCPEGGLAVHAGVDLDGNGELASEEITSRQYVCHGARGTDGMEALVSVTDEPAGANCARGGSRVSVGLDANSNGVLDPAEVGSTAYVCTGATGAPGPGVIWQEVTDTAVQASVNSGYMASHPTEQVNITLPATPSVGDVVQAMGTGAGGWRLVQNPEQRIITKAFGEPAGLLWTAHESERNWTAIASSADGIRLAAAVGEGQLYTSSDSGATWTARESNRDWQAIASSADGTRLVAAGYGTQLYVSTDAGATWTARESARNWVAVASSADGTRLAAAVYGGQLHTSSDAGVTWTARESNRNWTSITSSPDGTRLAATAFGGQLFLSRDGGVSWYPRENNRDWRCITMSADGTRLAAMADGNQFFTSSDSGETWTARQIERAGYTFASSADGRRLAIAGWVGRIYTSIDVGATWTARENSRYWRSIASSADGTRLAAVATNGRLYTSSPHTTPGVEGGISGGQFDAIHLQYLGSGVFAILSYAGELTVH